MCVSIASAFVTVTGYFCLKPASKWEVIIQHHGQCRFSHPARGYKHVPRLRAHRAKAAMGKNKAALPRAFVGAYPPRGCLSHAAFLSLF